jgi:CPA1 family monovalent cation:H+ antiporter
MGLAFVPGLRPVALDPELALALFLPPLLQVSAYRTDWPAFRSNLRPILVLAIGGVFFTAVAVAGVAKLMVPSLPWWAAVALGAIVAPPDAVAASSVLKQFKLPKRMVVVLEGESLINDASSLVLYRFAVAAVLAGTVSYGHGALQFVAMAAGGALVGWLVGRLAMWIFARIDDTLLEITLSLLAGFAAYLAAEALHVSGVLGAVACGLLLGRQGNVEGSSLLLLAFHPDMAAVQLDDGFDNGHP